MLSFQQNYLFYHILSLKQWFKKFPSVCTYCMWLSLCGSKACPKATRLTLLQFSQNLYLFRFKLFIFQVQPHFGPKSLLFSKVWVFFLNQDEGFILGRNLKIYEQTIILQQAFYTTRTEICLVIEAGQHLKGRRYL